MIKNKQLINILLPVVIILTAFLLSSFWIILMGKNPLDAFATLFRGAFGSSVALVGTIKNPFLSHSVVLPSSYR